MPPDPTVPSTTDDLSVGILRADADRRILYGNAAARSLLGPVSGRARRLAAFGPLGNHLDALARRAQETRSPVFDHESAAAVGLLDITVTPEPAADGRCGLLIEVVSLSWHASAWAERQATSLQAGLQQMLRGLAHELKNPLGGLRGAAQLLTRQVRDPALRDYCRVIVREADRLAGLVDRYGADAGPLRLTRINVHEAMERVFQLASVDERMRVVRDYDPSIPEVDGNLDALIQAILNLVNNAVQAGAANVVLRTRIRRRGPDRGQEPAAVIALEVEDDGPGVPDALGISILYPMVSGSPAGSGLGLTVVQAIAARHGGRLDFESRAGRTVFTVQLPLSLPHG